MKKIFFTLCLVILLCIGLFAQTVTPENFYVTKTRMDAFYDSIRQIIGESALNEDESGYIKYKAWVHEWEPMVFPSGDLTIPYNAINNIAQNHTNSSHSSTSVISNWTELGPTVQPNGGWGTGTGVVHFVLKPLLVFSPTNR